MESRKSAVLMDLQSGYSCSQSIFAAYFDLFEGIQDREAALKVPLPFGGGLAGIQGVCGAGVRQRHAFRIKVWRCGRSC